MLKGNRYQSLRRIYILTLVLEREGEHAKKEKVISQRWDVKNEETAVF